MGKLHLANHKLKKSVIAILVSDKVDFNTEIITRSKIRFS